MSHESKKNWEIRFEGADLKDPNIFKQKSPKNWHLLLLTHTAEIDIRFFPCQ